MRTEPVLWRLQVAVISGAAKGVDHDLHSCCPISISSPWPRCLPHSTGRNRKNRVDSNAPTTKGFGALGMAAQGPVTRSADSRTRFGSGDQIKVIVLAEEKICSLGSSVRMAVRLDRVPQSLETRT